jgi:hypothetical protein
MISTIHPQRFKNEVPNYRFPKFKAGVADENLILIPLRGVCKDATEVVSLIERIFRDIAAQKPLRDFVIAKEINSNNQEAYSNAVILKPTLWGMGVDLKEIFKTWKSKNA